MQVLVGLAGAALLLAGAYVVLAPFLTSLAWAAILAYATWPVYRRVRALCRGRDLGAALLMTALVVLAVALPVTGLSVALADDVAAVVRLARGWVEDPPPLPAWAADLPVVGPSLTGWYAALAANPGALRRLLVERASWWTQAVLRAVGGLGQNAAKLGLTLLTVFFLYRHGEALLGQARQVIRRLAGERVRDRLEAVGDTVRGVCYGVLLTALAQGLLAGLGFWAAGVRAAVLLGALTAVLALLPFGPPLVWAPVALWVLATGPVWKGVALLLWGALAVSGVDNVLRPYFIGGAARVPFLLVFLGVLGGVGAFGLLGLFIGPSILAVLLALWREWAAEAAGGTGEATP